MKQRLHLIILLAAVTLSGMAQTIGEAFYIYRNDGQFNAFFRDEVISIEYSYEDAEGNTYDEIVTQIVNTPDSVYKIPLAAIDSVGFLTPETQYKPGVIKIEGNLRDYVISSDELLITFSSTIPSALLPQTGDKLVTLEQDDKFPYGFLGGVVSTETDASGNHLVKCEAISMREVFDCYYGVSSNTYTDNSPAFVNSNRRAFWNFNPGTFRFPLAHGIDYSVQLDGNYAYEYSPNMFFEVTPELRVSAFMILPIGGDNDTYVSLTCIGDFHLLEHLEASGALQWSRDWGWENPQTHLPVLSWPIPDCPLVRFYIEPGVFLKASSKISSQMEFTQDYQLVFHYDASYNYGPSLRQEPPRFTPVSNSFSGQITMTGSVALGGYAEMGFLIQDKDFAHLCLRGEIGIEFESNAVLLRDDINTAASSTSVYERFHDTGFNLNWFYGVKLEGRVWPFTASYNLPVGNKGKIYSLGHVPTFSDVELKANTIGSLHAEANVSGDLLSPVDIGFALFNDDGERLDTYFSGEAYQDEPTTIEYTFTDVEEGRKYKVYPVVRYNGVEMLASPSAETESLQMPVKITDFEQTNSRYEKDAFTHNGRTYSYKFDCAVTIELANSENVDDWGYVYEDPDGQLARISLNSYGSPYTDTRYAYYRNEASSTVRLYEYVKFADDNEYYYGEPKDYEVSHQNETSCPDNNHPHWIDLGIGTLWRCCNEGASSPEGFGGYYTFDQAQAYNPPSLEQIEALENNCSYTWTTQNGVAGGKFTGPNGGTIFFPAAGYLDGVESYNVGFLGDCWSSAARDEGKAYKFVLGYDRVYWNSRAERSTKRSVRSVR